MKKYFPILLAAALITALSSCTMAANLSEAEAKEAINVVSSAASGSLQNPDSRSADALSRVLAGAVNFTSTQSTGGTAVFTVTTENSDVVSEDDTFTAAAYFSVEFTDFIVEVTDDADVTTEYTLNGTMYMEYNFALLSVLPYSIEYSILTYTGSEDALYIDGGSMSNALLELNSTNTTTLTVSSTGYEYTYSISGTCNGHPFTEETGTFSANVDL